MTSSLIDGDTEIVTTVESDGRVRVTVWVHGEMLAAPTFAATTFSQASLEVCDEIMRVADREAGQ